MSLVLFQFHFLSRNRHTKQEKNCPEIRHAVATGLKINFEVVLSKCKHMLIFILPKSNFIGI